MVQYFIEGLERGCRAPNGCRVRWCQGRQPRIRKSAGGQSLVQTVKEQNCSTEQFDLTVLTANNCYRRQYASECLVKVSSGTSVSAKALRYKRC